MRHVHKHFSRGYVSDGDSNDLPGDALLAALNVDLDVGLGEARVRPGLEQYTDIGNMPVGASGYGALPVEPNGGKWRLFNWIQWDSGITDVQHNTMLAYRERNAADTGWENTWLIFSDAPSGGGTGSFVPLLATGMSINQYFTAPVCNFETINGMVFVAFGPAIDGMVFTNLCEEGDRTLPTMTISSLTYDQTRDFGEGGHIYAGWLWDYWKLYWSDPVTAGDEYTVSTTSYINAQMVAAGSRAPLEKCAYVFAVCPVYDDYDQQYGVPIYLTLDKALWASGTDQVAKFTFAFAAGVDTYNPRINHFAIYGQKRDRTDRVDDNDLSRLTTVPFSSLTASVDVYIDDSMFSNIEGTWAADSKGRPVTLHAGDALGSFSTAFRRLNVKTDYVDQEITVKASGFTLRRKRMLAWGINGDPGQSKWAISMPDTNTTGQVNVFWKLNRIWREGSRQTTFGLVWLDRLFVFNRHNSYWIDLELRLDDQTMELDQGFGLGTDLVRTIARGSGALYWANRNSVYRFTNGTPEDLLENLWRDEWRQIPDARKADAVAGFCFSRAEYWLSVQTGDEEWTVYVWDDQRSNWRKYRFMYDNTASPPTANFIPGGFINDAVGKWVIYGRIRSTSYEDALVFDEGARLDDGDAITGELGCQWTGERDTELVLHQADLQRQSDDEMWLDLYHNRLTAPTVSVPFPATRKHAARLPRIRCYDYRFRVRFTYTDAANTPPRIQQITIDSVDDIKRSK